MKRTLKRAALVATSIQLAHCSLMWAHAADHHLELALPQVPTTAHVVVLLAGMVSIAFTPPSTGRLAFWFGVLIHTMNGLVAVIELSVAEGLLRSAPLPPPVWVFLSIVVLSCATAWTVVELIHMVFLSHGKD